MVTVTRQLYAYQTNLVSTFVYIPVEFFSSQFNFISVVDILTLPLLSSIIPANGVFDTLQKLCMTLMMFFP